MIRRRKIAKGRIFICFPVSGNKNKIWPEKGSLTRYDCLTARSGADKQVVSHIVHAVIIHVFRNQTVWIHFLTKLSNFVYNLKMKPARVLLLISLGWISTACLPIPTPPPPVTTDTPSPMVQTETATFTETATITETASSTPSITPTETITASSTSSATETITPTPTASWTPSPAPVTIPGAEDWDAGTLAFSHGAEGEWDHILWGGFANSLIKKGDTYYLYYQGSPYYDEQCESVAGRAIGVATSTDGRTWTKSPSNPVITWSSHGSVEEGAVGSAAWLGADGRIYVYYGANTGTGCTIRANLRLAVSEDGEHFQDAGEVLSAQNPDVWGAGDEFHPVGVYSLGSQWNLYYIPNGVPLARKLGVAIGGAPDSFMQSTGLNESTVPAWGPVSAILDGSQSVLVTNPEGVDGPLNFYRFDAADPTFVLLQNSYDLPNCKQASVIYEERIRRWMMSCRDQLAENYYIRTASSP